MSKWNSLPADIVNAPSVDAFKGRLDRFWSSQEARFNYKAEFELWLTPSSAGHKLWSGYTGPCGLRPVAVCVCVLLGLDRFAYWVLLRALRWKWTEMQDQKMHHTYCQKKSRTKTQWLKYMGVTLHFRVPHYGKRQNAENLRRVFCGMVMRIRVSFRVSLTSPFRKIPIADFPHSAFYPWPGKGNAHSACSQMPLTRLDMARIIKDLTLHIPHSSIHMNHTCLCLPAEAGPHLPTL